MRVKIYKYEVGIDNTSNILAGRNIRYDSKNVLIELTNKYGIEFN